MPENTDDKNSAKADFFVDLTILSGLLSGMEILAGDQDKHAVNALYAVTRQANLLVKSLDERAEILFSE